MPFCVSYGSPRLLVNTKRGQRGGGMGQQLGAPGQCSRSTFHPQFQPFPALHRFYPDAEPGAGKPQTPQPRISSYPLTGTFLSPPNPSFPHPALAGVSLLSSMMLLAWRASAAGKRPTCRSCSADTAATGLPDRREPKVSGGCRRGSDNSVLL